MLDAGVVTPRSREIYGRRSHIHTLILDSLLMDGDILIDEEDSVSLRGLEQLGLDLTAIHSLKRHAVRPLSEWSFDARISFAETISSPELDQQSVLELSELPTNVEQMSNLRSQDRRSVLAWILEDLYFQHRRDIIALEDLYFQPRRDIIAHEHLSHVQELAGAKLQAWAMNYWMDFWPRVGWCLQRGLATWLHAVQHRNVSLEQYGSVVSHGLLAETDTAAFRFLSRTSAFNSAFKHRDFDFHLLGITCGPHLDDCYLDIAVHRKLDVYSLLRSPASWPEHPCLPCATIFKDEDATRGSWVLSKTWSIRGKRRISTGSEIDLYTKLCICTQDESGPTVPQRRSREMASLPRLRRSQSQPVPYVCFGRAQDVGESYRDLAYRRLHRSLRFHDISRLYDVSISPSRYHVVRLMNQWRLDRLCGPESGIRRRDKSMRRRRRAFNE